MRSLRRCGPTHTHTDTHNSNNCQVKSVAKPTWYCPHSPGTHTVHSHGHWQLQQARDNFYGFFSCIFFRCCCDDHHRWPKFHASHAKSIAHPHTHSHGGIARVTRVVCTGLLYSMESGDWNWERESCTTCFLARQQHARLNIVSCYIVPSETPNLFVLHSIQGTYYS